MMQYTDECEKIFNESYIMLDEAYSLVAFGCDMSITESIHIPDTIKRYINKFIVFIKKMWKQFVKKLQTAFGNFFGASANEVKDSSNTIVPVAYIDMIHSKLILKQEKLSGRYLKKFLMSIIRNFASMVKITINNQIEYISSYVYNLTHSKNEAGRIEKFPGYTSLLNINFIGDDAIQSDEKSLVTFLRDQQYQMILDSKDVVKAYNDFLQGEVDACIYQLDRRKMSREKYDRKMQAIITKAKKEYSNLYNTSTTEQEYIFEKIKDISVHHYYTEYFNTEFGASLSNMLESIELLRKSYESEGKLPPTNKQILDELVNGRMLWYSDNPEIIKQKLKLRINYNVNMRNMLSNIIRRNFELFQLSLLESQILSNSVKDASSGTSYRKVLDNIMKLANRFVTASGTIDFSSIGAGIVYVASNSTTDFIQYDYAPQIALGLAMKYNYTIITHAYSNQNFWRIFPVRINGRMYNNLDSAINAIIDIIEKRPDRYTNTHKLRSFTIAAVVCNEDGFELEPSTRRRIKERNIMVVMADNTLSTTQKSTISTYLTRTGYKDADEYYEDIDKDSYHKYYNEK